MRLREQLRLRQRNLCAICGQPFVYIPRLPRVRELRSAHRVTFDHIVTRHNGGTNDPANLRVAHAICNEYRASEEHPENLALIEEGKKTPDCVAFLLADRQRRRTARIAASVLMKHALQTTYQAREDLLIADVLKRRRGGSSVQKTKRGRRPPSFSFRNPGR